MVEKLRRQRLVDRHVADRRLPLASVEQRVRTADAVMVWPDHDDVVWYCYVRIHNAGGLAGVCPAGVRHNDGEGRPRLAGLHKRVELRLDLFGRGGVKLPGNCGW